MDIVINSLIVSLTVTCVVFCIYFTSLKYFKKFFLFYNYKRIIDMFEYFLEKSYSMTYENSIISWIANGMNNTIPDEEKETIERDFIKQTFLMMGERNREIISQFFGGDSYLITYMIIYIRKKIANDGLADVIKNATSMDSAQITRI